MCDYCDGSKTDKDIIWDIQCNDVPKEVFRCDEGWVEASRIWGKYGWAKKIISADEWREVCRSRGYYQ